MDDKQQANMIRLTGLWEGEKGVLSGSISPSARLVIMPNRIKRSSHDPDFVAYIQAPGIPGIEESRDKPAARQQRLWQDRYDD